jgi:DNA mismatch repair protein MutS2
MDERSLRVLEYYKVRDMLENCVSCGLGRERVRALLPRTQATAVEEMQNETSEARAALDAGKQIPLGGIRDIRPAVHRASVGAMLGCDELLDVLFTLASSRRLKKSLAALGEAYPVLSDAARGIDVPEALERAIEEAISESGEVLDRASPALRGIRSRIRSLNSRVRDTLDSIIRSAQWGKILQDPIVSIRNGRFVVPVRAEMRSQASGIVHDQSGSGATLFIEPMVVVDLNNEIRAAVAQEEAEVERILMELSGRVGAARDRLDITLATLGRVDFVMARGKLSQQMGASRPILNSEGYISLIGARHPLLRGDVVPIDPYLGRNFTTLVITGPNTGGKTVTLKTIGLLTLMAQSGLHIPAEPGSEVALFDQVFADIGDEQSIEQSLSTFSSHLTHIVEILKQVDGSSLVLLDELGAGTDPQEGAGLAMSILEHLHATCARTVATTHYSELKVFAHTTEGFSNASVEFDVQTLRPTFRLSIGVPGASNAFAIAERLGLDRAILDRAQSLVGVGGQRMETMIISLKEEHERASAARSDAEALRARYLNLKDKYEAQVSKFAAERTEIMRKARAEAELVVREARREAEAIIGRLRTAQAEQAARLSTPASADSGGADEEMRRARRDLEALRDLARELTSMDEAPDVRGAQETRPEHAVAEDDDDSAEMSLGDEVEIIALGQRGRILERTGADEFVVSIGLMRVNAKRDSLRRLRSGSGDDRRKRTTPGSAGGIVSIESEKARTILTELDLRGMRVDEALDAVDKYLDDAVLSGLPRARIIHGRGTGALREAVRDQLRQDRRVASHRPGEAGEGGDGVTVVSFQRD